MSLNFTNSENILLIFLRCMTPFPPDSVAVPPQAATPQDVRLQVLQILL